MTERDQQDQLAWSDEYEQFRPALPLTGDLRAEHLRAVGLALKATGLMAGPLTAAGAAGIILIQLEATGWELIRKGEV